MYFYIELDISLENGSITLID